MIRQLLPLCVWIWVRFTSDPTVPRSMNKRFSFCSLGKFLGTSFNFYFFTSWLDLPSKLNEQNPYSRLPHEQSVNRLSPANLDCRCRRPSGAVSILNICAVLFESLVPCEKWRKKHRPDILFLIFEVSLTQFFPV